MNISRRALLGVRGLLVPQSNGPRSVLIFVFLRGGMDGLHVVPPHGDESYRSLRQGIAIPSPGEINGALDLDGFFSLHPELAPLLDLFRDKKLAIVHACGGPDRSLSHFKAQRNIGLGVGGGGGAGSGWLTRLLRADGVFNETPLAAVAMGERLPESLFGGSGALVLPSLADYRLKLPGAWSGGFSAALNRLYSRETNGISIVGRRTQGVMETLAQLVAAPPAPRGGATYPDTNFGRQLRELASVVYADLGLCIAQIDLGGWDTHVDQPSGMAGLMRDLAGGLSAFYTDLGEAMQHVTVVALSEFGRRAAEGGGLGTDHGRGGVCFVLGDGIRGGRVLSHWPGLAEEQLDADGNLPVTTDYRDVFAEILSGRLGIADCSSIFPEHTLTPVHIV